MTSYDLELNRSRDTMQSSRNRERLVNHVGAHFKFERYTLMRMREQKTAIHRGPPTLMFIKIYRSIDNTNHSNKSHTCAEAQRDVTQQYTTNF